MYEPERYEVADAKSNTQNFKLITCSKECLLDLGANVGEVTKYAIENGFERVVAVEAHPENFDKMVSRNIAGDIMFYNRAVASSSGEIMNVSSPNKSINCTARRKKRLVNIHEDYYREVETIGIQDLIDEHKPTVIKMDIEGSEYEVIEAMEFNDELRFMMIEMHGIRSRNGWAAAKRAEAKILRAGFKRIKPKQIRMHPNNHPRGFYDVFVYERF